METKNEGAAAPRSRSPRLPKGPPEEFSPVDDAELARRVAKLAAEKDARAMAPFSPAPWWHGGRMIADGRGLALATMAQAQPRQADMRLIAAAPELYRVLYWFRDSLTWFVLGERERVIIGNALAAVEGTAPKAPPAASSSVEAGRTGNEPDGEEDAE